MPHDKEKKNVVFINNDLSYFLLHRKKFCDYFITKKFNLINYFPNNQKILFKKKNYNEINNINFFYLSRQSINIFKEIYSIFQIVKIFYKSNPYVLYTSTIKLNLYCVIVNFFFRRKIIINFSGLGFFYVNKNFFIEPSKKIIEFLFKIFSNSFSISIFENSHDMQYFVKKNIFLKKNCFTLNGVGVNTHKFYPAYKELENEIIILMVARLIKEKGVLDFLECAKLSRNNQRLKFILLGKEEVNSKTSVNFDIINIYLKNCNLKYFDWTNNIIDFYHKAHIAILPSYREGMSVFLMEAISCGIPIIASNIPSNQYIVKEDVNGHLINLNSPKEMQYCINKIVNDKKKYINMSQNSRNFALAYFSEKKIMKDFTSILDKFIID